ncbi:MAG: phosphoribosylglycinamide formyltransferase [Candidatus Omnitrophota bacterium]
MMNIAIFASGRGTNFSAIVRAAKLGKIAAKVSLLVCDNPKALVIKKAKRAGVEVFLIKRSDFTGRDDFEDKIIQRLGEAGIGLIVLAGFMRLLGPRLIQKFKSKILNIHPAILPSFKGAHAIGDAFNYGIKVTGVSVHFVDEEMDHGPIILQRAVKIDQAETLESLESKIHKIEHKIYPEAIKLFIEGRLKVEGRKVKIL